VKRASFVAIATMWAHCASPAATLVYEGFNYPVGTNLPGQNGGSGWMGAWLGPNLGGATGGSDLPFVVTNGLSWTNGPGYVAGVGGSIFDEDDGGSNHSVGHGDARQWFDPTNPLKPFDSVYGTNIWFSCLARYDVVSTSGGIVVPFEDSFMAFSGVGVSLKGGPGGLQVYIRQHGVEMSTNTVNYLQAPGGLTNVAMVVGRFRLGPVVANPILLPGNDRLDVWLNQTREPTNDSPLYMAGFSALRTAPYSQGYLVVRTGGWCQMVVDEIKIGTNFSDVVPASAASPNPKPAPPLLALESAGPVGLQFNAGAGTTNQYNEITTLPGFECSWVGSASTSSPAIYSFAVTNPPASGSTNFTAYAWLISSPNGFISAEISNPNVVRLGIEDIGNGAAVATLGYKANDPDDVAMFSGAGFLCGITNVPFAGQWTISLSNDTDFTLTAPNGATATSSMQSGDTSSFSSQVQFFLGATPNVEPNIGRFMTVGSAFISITSTNGTNIISSDFTRGAPLDSGTWTILADDPASVIAMPAESVYRVSWDNAVGSGVGLNSLIYTNALGGSGGWIALPPGSILGDGTNVVFVTRNYVTNGAGFLRVSIPYTQ
jgi:hypothetical protein